MVAPRSGLLQRSPQGAGEACGSHWGGTYKSQLQAIERKQEEKQAHGEIETEHPGYLGSQDTFYVGTLKGVGRVYQQTYVDTYCKVAHAKLYTSKTPITAADLLNERVLPFYEEHELPVLRLSLIHISEPTRPY